MNAAPGQLRRQVHAWKMRPTMRYDDGAFVGAVPLGAAIESNCDRPVVLAGILARAQKFSLLDRQVPHRTAEHAARAIQEQRPDLCADEAYRGAAHGDRIAARGEALGGAHVGLAGHDPQLLRPTSSSSAAICASAVRIPCPISTFPVSIRTRPFSSKLTHCDREGIVDEALRQRIGNHADVPMRAPARATRPQTRLCIRSGTDDDRSAAAISLRLGRGLRLSSAAADIKMPERQ